LYRSFVPEPKLAKTQVVIIGLDGFSWNVINYLLKNGELPQMKELMEEGVYGDLSSLEPILSPAIWTSIATCTVPEKHGIIRFESLQSQLKYKRIWEILEEKGEKIGVFRWYMTWPPKKSQGFIVPCWIARSPEVWPTELSYINFWKERIPKLSKTLYFPYYLIKSIQGRMRLSTLLYHLYTRIFLVFHSQNSLRCIPKLMRDETLRDWDIFLGLLRKYQPNFAAILFTQGDYLSHHYWKYFEPQYFREVSPQEVREFGRVIPEYYRLADRLLGEIQDRLNEETLLVIVSDHGFTRGSHKREWMFTLKT